MATKKPIRDIKTALSVSSSETPLSASAEPQKSEPVNIPQVEKIDKVIHVSEDISAEDKVKLEAIDGIPLEELIRYATRKKKELKSERMNIALYPSLKKRLHRVADTLNSSVNDLVIRLLDKGLSQYEH